MDYDTSICSQWAPEKILKMLVPGPNDSNFSGLAMNIGLYGWVYMRCNHSTSLEQNYLQKTLEKAQKS